MSTRRWSATHRCPHPLTGWWPAISLSRQCVQKGDGRSFPQGACSHASGYWLTSTVMGTRVWLRVREDAALGWHTKASSRLLLLLYPWALFHMELAAIDVPPAVHAFCCGVLLSGNEVGIAQFSAACQATSSLEMTDALCRPLHMGVATQVVTSCHVLTMADKPGVFPVEQSALSSFCRA